LSEGEFVGVGGALEERGVERADPFGVGAGGGECGAGGEVAGLLEDEGAVEKEKGLLGDGGGEALGAAGVGVGEIKGAEEAGEVLAVDETVDGAAAGEGFLREIVGEAAGGEVELAGGGEEGVAEGFEFEAAAVKMGEELVVGIGGERGETSRRLG